MSRRSTWMLVVAAIAIAAWWSLKRTSEPATAHGARAQEPDAAVAVHASDERTRSGLAPVSTELALPVRATATQLQLLCIDAVTRAPIAGARATSSDGIESISDERGSMRMALPRVEGCVLRVTVDGYEAASLELDPTAVERGETIVCALAPVTATTDSASFEVTFVLPGPRVLEPFELIVERRDLPAPAASDRLVRRWRCTFDANMRARVGQLPSGVELFGSVLRSGRIVYAAPLGAVLAPGEARRVVWWATVALVRVTARETSGAPVAGLELWLAKGSRETGDGYFMPLEHPEQVARTDGQGQCVFADVQPGSWRVGPARASATDVAREDELPCALARAVAVQSGTPIDVELVVRRGRFIRGRVLGPDAKPHGSGVVLALASEQLFVTADVADDGRFRLGPLLPGRYKVSVVATEDDTLTSSVVEAEAGADDVTLRLGNGAVISGRVLGFEADTAERPWVQVDGEAVFIGHSLQCDADGAFRFEGMADAVYTIRTGDDQQIAALTGVKVHDAQDVTGLVLQLQPAGRLRLKRAGARVVHVRITHGLGVVDELSLTSDEAVTQLVVAGATIVEVLGAEQAPRSRNDLVLAAGETRELVLRADD